MSAISGSGPSCRRPQPVDRSQSENADWFNEEKETVIGKDVSLLLQDATEEIAETKTLTQLFKEQGNDPLNTVLWAQEDRAKYQQTFAVVQVLYTRQAVLRFRVTEDIHLVETGKIFLGHPANDTKDVIATLIEISSACGTQGHARELPDPGFEMNYESSADEPMGVNLVRPYQGQPVSLSPLETGIVFYEESRLQRPTFNVTPPDGGLGIWKAHADEANKALHKAIDSPKLDDGSRFFHYCSSKDCDAVMTGVREFVQDDDKGVSYSNNGRAHGCVFGKPDQYTSFFHRIRVPAEREPWLRDMVVFFGPKPEPKSLGDYTNYTPEIAQSFPGAAPSHAGPATTIWVYEYRCRGGLVDRDPAAITKLGVEGHLKGWELDK